MLATATIPKRFQTWNARWGAPHGRGQPTDAIARLRPSEIDALGPFAWQANNPTRSFEYPWVYHVIEEARAARVVEVGGGLSGLQFVLARDGRAVTNIDPGGGTGDWTIDAASHLRLQEVFGARVSLEMTTIGGAGIPAGSTDVLFSVSALEHFSDAALEEFADEVPRLLRPDGFVVLTVDLFLDVAPFEEPVTNRFGRNIDIAGLLARAGLRLRVGDRRELHGFREFDAARVLERRASYLESPYYPALAQCLIAEIDPGAGRLGQP